MPTIIKNKIIFDHRDWLAGQHPQSGVGNPELLNGYDDADSFDPLRFLGSACPGKEPTDVLNTSIVNSIIKSIGYSPETTRGYGAGGSKIHEINKSTGEITNSSPFPHTIPGSVVFAEDIINYQISGVDYMFYSWNEVSTNGDVGRLITSSGTFDDDFMSTVPTGAVKLDKDQPHPMILGDDDNLYIGNGNILASYDGPNDTFTPSVLVLREEDKIRSFAKLDNNTLVIFASPEGGSSRSSGHTVAYFWDYVNKDPYKKHLVSGLGCGGGFEYSGSVGVWTSGASGDPGENNRIVRLNLFDGSSFVELGSIVAGNAPGHGGVEVIGKTIYGNAEGDIYRYGSPFVGVKCGIVKVARGGGTTAGGAIRTLTSGRQLISTGTSTAGGLQIITGGYNTSNFYSAFASPFFGQDKRGKVKSVRTEFLKSASGGRSLSAYLVNQENVSIGIIHDVVRDIAANRTIITNRGLVFEPFDTLQLRLDWESGSGSTDAPIVRRVIVEFEEVRNL